MIPKLLAEALQNAHQVTSAKRSIYLSASDKHGIIRAFKQTSGFMKLELVLDKRKDTGKRIANAVDSSAVDRRPFTNYVSAWMFRAAIMFFIKPTSIALRDPIALAIYIEAFIVSLIQCGALPIHRIDD